MDFQHYIMKTYLLFSIHAPHALTHCSLRTLSSPWRYLPSLFITLTQSVRHRALQMFSLPLAGPCPHSPIYSNCGLIMIPAVIELRSSFNWVYLCNQITVIKTQTPYLANSTQSFYSANILLGVIRFFVCVCVSLPYCAIVIFLFWYVPAERTECHLLMFSHGETG